MAKKRKAKNPTRKQLEEIDNIKNNLEIYTQVKAECQFCDEIHDDSDDVGGPESVLQSNAEYLHKEGWREVLSDHYALEGLACPTCAKKKDKDR